MASTKDAASHMKLIFDLERTDAIKLKAVLAARGLRDKIKDHNSPIKPQNKPTLVKNSRSKEIRLNATSKTIEEVPTEFSQKSVELEQLLGSDITNTPRGSEGDLIRPQMAAKTVDISPARPPTPVKSVVAPVAVDKETSPSPVPPPKAKAKAPPKPKAPRPTKAKAIKSQKNTRSKAASKKTQESDKAPVPDVVDLLNSDTVEHSDVDSPKQQKDAITRRSPTRRSPGSKPEQRPITPVSPPRVIPSHIEKDVVSSTSPVSKALEGAPKPTSTKNKRGRAQDDASTKKIEGGKSIEVVDEMPTPKRARLQKPKPATKRDSQLLQPRKTAVTRAKSKYGAKGNQTRELSVESEQEITTIAPSNDIFDDIPKVQRTSVAATADAKPSENLAPVKKETPKRIAPLPPRATRSSGMKGKSEKPPSKAVVAALAAPPISPPQLELTPQITARLNKKLEPAKDDRELSPPSKSTAPPLKEKLPNLDADVWKVPLDRVPALDVVSTPVKRVEPAATAPLPRSPSPVVEEDVQLMGDNMEDVPFSPIVKPEPVHINFLEPAPAKLAARPKPLPKNKKQKAAVWQSPDFDKVVSEVKQPDAPQTQQPTTSKVLEEPNESSISAQNLPGINPKLEALSEDLGDVPKNLSQDLELNMDGGKSFATSTPLRATKVKKKPESPRPVRRRSPLKNEDIKVVEPSVAEPTKPSAQMPKEAMPSPRKAHVSADEITMIDLTLDDDEDGSDNESELTELSDLELEAPIEFVEAREETSPLLSSPSPRPAKSNRPRHSVSFAADTTTYEFTEQTPSPEPEPFFIPTKKEQRAMGFNERIAQPNPDYVAPAPGRRSPKKLIKPTLDRILRKNPKNERKAREVEEYTVDGHLVNLLNSIQDVTISFASGLTLFTNNETLLGCRKEYQCQIYVRPHGSSNCTKRAPCGSSSGPSTNPGS
ncbi:hypothetical protein BOTBODRAFT_511937 [Botryobasidium botryosum FD-172 SS1]|uniref:Uncharacterized protein n=1 Tax=Botryobasidium botryosum (strain FD-172 SS1) TaxID=930990 RepID=A0A067N2U0_BOTB1|nr:hypothetical protein BOTBODRAFT_511937 [Botryobasidium botryosum FD-172 SS1]